MTDERPHPYFDQHCPTCGSPVRVEQLGQRHYMVPTDAERVAVLEAKVRQLEIAVRAVKEMKR